MRNLAPICWDEMSLNGRFGGNMHNVDTLDSLDARILLALDDDPDASILALSRALKISRNTVHARLQRLSRNTLLGFSQRVPPEAMGYHLVAFVSLAVSQTVEGASEKLQDIPEVVEIHNTTGPADLLVKVVATDTDELHRITKSILAIDGVERSNTAISLSQSMPNRTRALLERAATG